MGFTVTGFLEYLLLPVVTAAMTVIVHRATRKFRLDLQDLAVGLDLIVGALFALGLNAVQLAVYYHRQPFDWFSPDTKAVLAALALLATTGVVVRQWGWNPHDATELRLTQGVIVPMAASIGALLLVVQSL
jgi:ABC-type Co2+ transport system permease subunit